MKKMSTWFKLPVRCMPSEVGDWMEHVNFGVKGLSSHHCEAIEDAINNHDRLTKENAKLREIIWEMVDDCEYGSHNGLSGVVNSKTVEKINQLKDQNNDK